MSILLCLSFFLLFIIHIEAIDHNVLMTEVFAIKLDSSMFNWTYQGRKNQFVFEASLVDSPDLPSWIHYVYSDRHHAGFLYGVPLSHTKGVVELDVVGLNKRTYETKVEKINIIVQEKLNTARNEINMKIDNLNVVDMFSTERMDALKEIFSKYLWKDAEDDLYVTFLQSAVELGARKPLNPKEGEGVVVRLGSEVMLSSELLELQEEIRPLYKIQSCPRDFKRTSVERFFRDAGFALDWCSFRIIQNDVNNSAMHKLNKNKVEAGVESLWEPAFDRLDIPERSYKKELITAIAVPMIIMTILVSALTYILCFEHDIQEVVVSSEDQSSPQRFLIEKTAASADYEINRNHSMSPDVMLLNRSYTNSPNSTMTRGVHCRPSPPPYVKPKYKREI